MWFGLIIFDFRTKFTITSVVFQFTMASELDRIDPRSVLHVVTRCHVSDKMLLLCSDAGGSN